MQVVWETIVSAACVTIREKWDYARPLSDTVLCPEGKGGCYIVHLPDPFDQFAQFAILLHVY